MPLYTCTCTCTRCTVYEIPDILKSYFSDTVAVSSIDYGLFMLEVDMASIEAQKQSDVTMGEQHRYRAALPGSDITACPPLVERRVCVPEEC